MKNISTGAGLAIVGLGIALHPVLSHVLAATPNANAAAPVSLVASTATGPVDPTVVWMGVTHNVNVKTRCYDRMWSDGRIEVRSVSGSYPLSGCSPYDKSLIRVLLTIRGGKYHRQPAALVSPAEAISTMTGLSTAQI